MIDGFPKSTIGTAGISGAAPCVEGESVCGIWALQNGILAITISFYAWPEKTKAVAPSDWQRLSFPLLFCGVWNVLSKKVIPLLPQDRPLEFAQSTFEVDSRSEDSVFSIGRAT